MWIRVTALDIKRGEPTSAFDCPLVRAARRATGYGWDFGVGVRNLFRYYGKTRPRVFPLPRTARVFIALFDDGKPVVPFSFQIRTGGNHVG